MNVFHFSPTFHAFGLSDLVHMQPWEKMVNLEWLQKSESEVWKILLQVFIAIAH